MGDSKKKIIPGPVAPDFDENAVVLHYTVESYPEEGGPPSRKAHTKKVRLKTLDEESNISDLADQIADRCEKYLSSGSRDLIYRQLQTLQMASMQQQSTLYKERMSRQKKEGEASATVVSYTQEDEGKEEITEGKEEDSGGKQGEPEDVEEKKDERETEEHRHSIQEQRKAQEQQEPIVSEKERKKELKLFEKKWKEDVVQRAEKHKQAKDNANLRNIEDYMEQLYDESVDGKLEGALHILELVREPDNMESILQNDALLGALARVLRDDFKKNVELTTVLMQIFYCMSHFKQLHEFLIHYEIGDIALKIAELEHRRHEARLVDLKRLTKLYEAQSRGDNETEDFLRKEDEEIKRYALEAKNKKKQSKKKSKKKASKDGSDGNDSHSDEEGEEKKADSADDDDSQQRPKKQTSEAKKKSKKKKTSQKNNENPNSPASAPPGTAVAVTGVESVEKLAEMKLRGLPEGQVDIIKERVRFRLLMRRQENLLFATFHVLLNIAEDLSLEKRMCSKGLVEYLSALLDRPNPDLLMLATTFLRKLSLFAENKDSMGKQKVIPRCVKLLRLPDAQEVVVQSALKLLLNLSFDRRLVQQMVHYEVGSTCASLLKQPAYRATTLKLWYNISIWEYGRYALGKVPSAVTLVQKLVTNFPQSTLPPELISLLINLSLQDECAKVFIGNNAPKLLVQRVTKYDDALLMKALKHLASYTFRRQCETIDQIDKEKCQLESLKKRLEDLEEEDDSMKHKMQNLDMRIRRRKIKALQRIGHEERNMDEESISSAELDIWEEFEYEAEGVWASVFRNILKLLRTKSTDMLVEAVGTLARLTPRDLPEGITYRDVLSNSGMTSFISNYLSSCTDDDLIVETILLVQNFALDKDCAELLVESDAVVCFEELLLEKAVDTEIVTQIAETVYRMLHHDETRQVAMYQTATVERLAEFALHKNPTIAAVVDKCLEIVVDYDRNAPSEEGTQNHPAGSLWRTAQAKRYQSHNREWCAAFAGNFSSFGVSEKMARYASQTRHQTDRFAESGYGEHSEDSMYESTQSNSIGHIGVGGEAVQVADVKQWASNLAAQDDEYLEKAYYRRGSMDVSSVGDDSDSFHYGQQPQRTSIVPDRWKGVDDYEDEEGDITKFSEDSPPFWDEMGITGTTGGRRPLGHSTTSTPEESVVESKY